MAGIVAAVAVALSIPMVSMVAANERTAIIAELQVEALSTASMLASQPYSAWSATVATAPSRADERVVVVDARGILVADSGGNDLDRAFDRPEITRALQGFMSSDVRFSRTLGTELRYVAAPVIKGEHIVAAVRYSLPESAVMQAVQRTVGSLALFVLAVTVAAAILAWLLALTIAAPVRRLAAVAAALPGDLDLRADERRGPREVREMAGAINVTAERLQGLVERTERVAADASHHLRTPLTGIRLRLEAIEDLADDTETAEQAHRALDEVDRLTRRIEQVLSLARTDAGSAPRNPVDASSVVRDRLAAFTLLAQERGVHIEADVADGLHVIAEVGTVPRILDELLGNALQYASAVVRVGLAVHDDRVHLVVEDDGPGVDDVELDAIFQRFARGAGATPGGTGLGLAMVRESARACDGDAVASASSLGGLRIEVMLPAQLR